MSDGAIAYGPHKPTSVPFTTVAANTFVVPQGVTLILVDAQAPGGGGGGGQASAATAGGGAGGSGMAATGYPLSVTPGETLTITIQAAGAAGIVGGAGGAGGDIIIAGANNPFPLL